MPFIEGSTGARPASAMMTVFKNWAGWQSSYSLSSSVILADGGQINLPNLAS
jgi:hypothetical protein